MACNALLLVLMRPPAHLEEEYTEWYDTEHLADRLTAPGFESGRRFRSITGGPHTYVTLYDLESTGALDTPEYRKLSRENFTPWTKRLMRRIPRLRSLAEQIHPGGAALAQAPFLTLLRFAGLPADSRHGLVEGVEACFARRPELVQIRIFAEPREGAFDFLALVGSTARVADAVTAAALGPAAKALNLVEEFAPHEIGMTWEKWI